MTPTELTILNNNLVKYVNTVKQREELQQMEGDIWATEKDPYGRSSYPTSQNDIAKIRIQIPINRLRDVLQLEELRLYKLLKEAGVEI